MSTFPCRFSRRAWLRTIGAGVCLGRLLGHGHAAEEASALPPMRIITRGPKFHWFGYYDKFQFDPTDRYVLGMEVDFEHRSPRPDDVIRIGMVDLQDGDRWIELGTSSAWCWQQGCMLQWRPGSQSEIVWNDRQGDHYVCHILDVKTGAKRTVGHPIYALSPDGRWAVAPDFRRVAVMRPGYGYAGLPDPYDDQLAPADSGVFRVDLETGQHQLIISLADVVKIPYPKEDFGQGKHWFNHLLVNPAGTRFSFLHRWRHPRAKSWQTRLLTAAPDGSQVRVLDQCGVTSHYIWRDPDHILAWSLQKAPGGFYLFEDKPDGRIELVYEDRDGHCSYLPDQARILCDTYPDAQRTQHVYLYHLPTRSKVFLGHFYQPPAYAGEWRCDTHPRLSRQGTQVCVDAPAGDQGRQLHLIDIRALVS